MMLRMMMMIIIIIIIIRLCILTHCIHCSEPMVQIYIFLFSVIFSPFKIAVLYGFCCILGSLVTL